MTTPRQPLPLHARDAIEQVRDALFAAVAEQQRLLDVTIYAADGDESDGWRALSHATGRAGTTINMLRHAQRLLESVEGVDAPPDTAAVQLVDERLRRRAQGQ